MWSDAKAEVPSAFAMSRPLRLQFPGALFHVTSRGNERRDIFRGDVDRVRFLELLAKAVERFRWILYAYVLMSNHFHLLFELTEEATLSSGMRWLNGRYAEAFNARHDRVGHLVQGPFDSRLIERETYFLEVARYVVLNPVRAGMVEQPEDYVWSSYRATIGESPLPGWLASDELLLHFADDRGRAEARYRCFVEDPIARSRNVWADLVGGMYLGSEPWIERMREKVELKPRCTEHPRRHRILSRPSMAEIITTVADLMRADEFSVRLGHGGIPRMMAAWLGSYEGLLTNAQIAAALRLRSGSRVTALVRSCERELTQNELIREAIDRCVSTLRRKNSQVKM
jgi:putative transposase